MNYYKINLILGIMLVLIAFFMYLGSHIDVPLSTFFLLSESKHLVFITKEISNTGSVVFTMGVGLFLTIILWVKKRTVDAIWFFLTLASSRIFFSLAKLLFLRHRPVFDHPFVHALNYSFPSGHSANALVLVLASFIVFNRMNMLVKLCFLGWVLLVSWSRLALGAHWTSDIIAGWGGGLLWMALAYRMREIMFLTYLRKKYALK